MREARRGRGPAEEASLLPTLLGARPICVDIPTVVSSVDDVTCARACYLLEPTDTSFCLHPPVLAASMASEHARARAPTAPLAREDAAAASAARASAQSPRVRANSTAARPRRGGAMRSGAHGAGAAPSCKVAQVLSTVTISAPAAAAARSNSLCQPLELALPPPRALASPRAACSPHRSRTPAQSAPALPRRSPADRVPSR